MRAIRVFAGAAFVLAILMGSEVLGQTPRGRYYSVPGTGVPAIRQPYYTPRYYSPYSRYPYGTYYRGPYYSVPGTGVPAYPPSYPPAPVATWRLGITGSDWPGVGVRISTIEPESAAEQMGIEVSDVIVQINGRPIRNMYDLRNAVAASGGYVRVLVLDNRTNSYMWHNGSLASAGSPIAQF